MQEIIVQNGEENIRLDSFVSNKIKDLSRTMIVKLIESGNIKINEKLQKPSYKTQVGDKINIEIPEAKEVNLKPQNIPINIIYEDNDIIVINKEKGIIFL